MLPFFFICTSSDFFLLLLRWFRLALLCCSGTSTTAPAADAAALTMFSCVSDFRVLRLRVELRFAAGASAFTALSAAALCREAALSVLCVFSPPFVDGRLRLRWVGRFAASPV